MSRSALEESFRGLLVEDARIDRSVVQLTKREERGQRDAAIAAAKRTVRQERKKKRRDLVRKRWVSLAAECRHLRTLDGVDQSELRLDHAGMGLRAAELDAYGAVKIDQVLNGQVTNAAVSR